jgi:hypothetical protein
MKTTIEMFASEKVKEFGILPFLNKMGWEEVGAAYMTPDDEIVNPIDMEEDDYETAGFMTKFRLRLTGVSADTLMMRAALTSEALKVSGLTYTLRESARDEETTHAVHIHIFTNDAYNRAVRAADMAAKVAKYGCLACSECRHQFDDWTTHDATGGHKKRAVVSHPLRTGTYRVRPCGSCPAKFCEEFESRMAKDSEMRKAIQTKWPDTFCH